MGWLGALWSRLLCPPHLARDSLRLPGPPGHWAGIRSTSQSYILLTVYLPVKPSPFLSHRMGKQMAFSDMKLIIVLILILLNIELKIWPSRVRLIVNSFTLKIITEAIKEMSPMHKNSWILHVSQ